MKRSIKMYADGTEMWKVIFNESDSRNLQKILCAFRQTHKAIKFVWTSTLTIKSWQGDKAVIDDLSLSVKVKMPSVYGVLKWSDATLHFCFNKWMYLQICV